MSPYESLVVVLLQACLASLPQQEGNKHRDIKKRLYPPYGSRRVISYLYLIFSLNSGILVSLYGLGLDSALFSLWTTTVASPSRIRKFILMMAARAPCMFSQFRRQYQIYFYLLRFGQSNKVRPYNREVFFFHNLCQNCKDSSGVLSWTVSRQ